jgi:isoleucyl-tRNA synthetase
MLAESTILVRRTPYRVCLGHGQVLAEDGQEMHKSWGNAIWFDDAAETMGADVIRWICCSTKPESNLLFGYKKANEVRRLFFMTLLNVYNFFYQYASLDGWTPAEQAAELAPLDRWVLGRLSRTVGRVTEALEGYDAHSACGEIDRFVDVLSKWYVRRSRRRFWKTEADDEKRAAYSTLYRCLRTVVLLLAPVTPHLSEALYQRMVRPVEPGAPLSVHHCGWPEVDESVVDVELLAEMDMAMTLSSMGRAARSQGGVKLRQPLGEAVVVAPAEDLPRLERVRDLVGEELNVKAVRASSDRGLLQSLTVEPVPSMLGRKHGRLFPRVAEAVRGLGSEAAEALGAGESVTVLVDGSPVEVLPGEVEVVSVPRGDYSVVEDRGLLVGVYTVLSGGLESEGLARDVVRRVQALRKEADFEIDDEIVTYYAGDGAGEDVFVEEAEYIMAETLSVELVRGEVPMGAVVKEYEIDGLAVRLGLVRR